MMLAIEDVDVVVIGMGPGGEEVASRLAESGLRVIGVEDALVGGECPYWGYIPSKMMIRAANVLALAVHERTSIARLGSMIYAYPTFHRDIEDALRDLETNFAKAHGS
jgi:pyruvate/2-oxoglutarate dehydrogenase complex dihydrolipoamide dehydrogenase (E3) component